jgi:hypothetical protein
MNLGDYANQATGGDLTGYGNIPAPTEHVCPCCGCCPCCGRGGYGRVPNYPTPYWPYWPNYPSPYIGDVPGWMDWNKIYCGTVNTTGNENITY